MSLGRPKECYQARLKALDLFNQTIEKSPLNASAWLSKAEILVYMGQNDEALKAYDKVIELEPGEYGVMNRKAEFLSAILGRYNESVEAYNRAIERIPANDTLNLGGMWGGKGSALYMAGRSEEALEAFSRAADLYPTDIYNWRMKGDIASELGRHNESLAAYDQVIKLDPKNVQAWSSKASELAEAKRYNESLEAYNELLQIDLTSGTAWMAKGDVLESMGNHKEALGSYQKAEESSSEAVKRDSNDTSAWRWKMARPWLNWAGTMKP